MTQLREYLQGRGEVEALSWARIQPMGDGVQLTLRIAGQICSLVNPTFDMFDVQTEDILIKIYGANHQYVESYKYATLGEAEAMVNLQSRHRNPRAETFRRRAFSSGARSCRAF